MHRRQFVLGLSMAGFIGAAGCLSDDTEDEELSGRGTLRIENHSGGEIQVAYGLLERDEPIDDAELETIRLTVDGDSFETVYPDVTGGPYRFVVTVPERDWEPVERQWDLEECREFEVTARVNPDALNMSGIRCVRRT